MATTTEQTSFQHHAGQGILGRIWTRILTGMENHMRLASRRDLIEMLEAKSDEELAELGIRRDDIARYVFRDMFYA